MEFLNNINIFELLNKYILFNKTNTMYFDNRGKISFFYFEVCILFIILYQMHIYQINETMTAITPISPVVFTFLKCEIFQSFQEAPEVEILFTLNGKKSTTAISSKDVLNYLQKAGKYAHEGFAVDMDGNYFVKEYRENIDREGVIKIDLEAKVKSLSSKEWGFVLTEAFRHVNPIHFHLYNI